MKQITILLRQQNMSDIFDEKKRFILKLTWRRSVKSFNFNLGPAQYRYRIAFLGENISLACVSTFWKSQTRTKRLKKRTNFLKKYVLELNL
jgi:hypothetical protein